MADSDASVATAGTAVPTTVTTVAAPRIGGGSGATAWVGGSNLSTARQTRPESTLARRPTDFKSAAQIEWKATVGLPKERRLSLDEKTSKITLTSWVNSIRNYMEERGMDTVFRIFDTSSNSEIYLLQDWGSADPISVAAWETSLLSGIDNLPVCDYDVDNLKWSGKAIMNSISLDLWETIEKDVGVGSNGPLTYAAVISKIQQVSASAVRSLVTQLKTMHLLAEPGQDVELFGSKIIDLTRRIEGSGRAPSDLTSIVAACFIDGDVLPFKIKALGLHDQVDSDPNCMPWAQIVRELKEKYRNLLAQDLWDPQKAKSPEAPSVLNGLQASINKLAAQMDAAGAGGNPGRGNGPPCGGRTVRCYDCGQEGHVRSECPLRGTPGSKSTPPAEGAPEIRTINGASETWCATCKRWTTGDREHSTVTHVRRSPRSEPPAPAPVPPHLLLLRLPQSTPVLLTLPLLVLSIRLTLAVASPYFPEAYSSGSVGNGPR